MDIVDEEKYKANSNSEERPLEPPKIEAMCIIERLLAEGICQRSI
jgi:hypothetical protein